MLKSYVMGQYFKQIALIARKNSLELVDTLVTLVEFLHKQSINIIVEAESAKLANIDVVTASEQDLGKNADLIIVIGGDGSLLRTAKSAAKTNTPILGVNRGTLGFLTDINPDDVCEKVTDVLAGQFTEEKRFFLKAMIHENGQNVGESLALNDIVLLPDKDVAKMIEFDVYVNKEFICHQRADGLIVATPTGSTAYALSGGGPIINPDLDAITLVSMFPHTLSIRPIVISANNRVKITIANDLETKPRISCDGGITMNIPAGGHLHIDKSQYSLRLIHPHGYNYFQTLRSKLHWSEKLC